MFLDLAKTFAANSKPGSPGENRFLEHVHFNIDGHWLVAREIARTITRDIRHQAWNEDLVPSTQERNDWLALVPEDSITALSLAFFITQSAPFDEAIGATARSKVLVEKVAELSNQLSARELLVFQSVSHGEQMDDLINGLGRIWLNAEEIEQANKMSERSIRRRPRTPNGCIFAGICEYLPGNTPAALEHIKKSQNKQLCQNPIDSSKIKIDCCAI